MNKDKDFSPIVIALMPIGRSGVLVKIKKKNVKYISKKQIAITLSFGFKCS